MSTTKVQIQFEPKEWQKEVINSLDRFNVLVIHRRAGKTFLSIHLLIRALFECKLKNPVVGLISPEKQQSIKNVWNDIKEIVAQIPGTTTNEVEHKVSFPNGGEFLLFGASNPDAIRGGYFDMVVLDEVAQMPASLWQDVVRPMLSDRQGKAVFIGTPKGRNLFYDVYKKASSGAEDWYGASFNVEQTRSLGTLSEEATLLEIESLKRDNTEDSFNQEYMCDFDAAIKGAYYAKELNRLRREGRVQRGLYDPEYPVDTGWDIGLDGTAIWYAQIFGNKINLIDFDFVVGEDIKWCFKNFIMKKDYTYSKHYVPHDSKKRSSADKKKSVLGIFIKHGLKTKTVSKPGNNMVDAEINIVKTQLIKCTFDADTCQKGLDYLSLYQQEWNDSAGIFMGKPKHDINSHPSDAFRTLIMGLKTDNNRNGISTPTQVHTQHTYDPYSLNNRGALADMSYDPFDI